MAQSRFFFCLHLDETMMVFYYVVVGNGNTYEGEMKMGSRKNESGKEKKENLHAGHRQRLRERYLQTGGAGMADHELLELMLTYAIPRSDVNPIAHRLLQTFGSFGGVFQASAEELKNVEGMGESSAVFLKTLVTCGQRCLQQYYKNGKRLDLKNFVDASRFALAEAAGDKYETLRIICLDSRYQFISTKVIYEGNTTSVPADPKRVIETALQSKAHFIIVYHNHPSGNLHPSRADEDVVQQIHDMATAVKLQVLDQMILGHGAAYSFYCNMVVVFTSPTNQYTLSLEEYEEQQSACSYLPPYYDDYPTE